MNPDLKSLYRDTLLKHSREPRNSDPETEMSLPNNDLNALSGVKEFPSRIRCATLPWEALLAALAGRMKDEV